MYILILTWKNDLFYFLIWKSLSIFWVKLKGYDTKLDLRYIVLFFFFINPKRWITFLSTEKGELHCIHNSFIFSVGLTVLFWLGNSSWPLHKFLLAPTSQMKLSFYLQLQNVPTLPLPSSLSGHPLPLHSPSSSPTQTNPFVLLGKLSQNIITELWFCCYVWG